MNVEDHVISVLTDKKNRKHFKDAIRTCTQPKDFDRDMLITMEQIGELLEKTTEVVREQPMLLELTPPVNICGDIHGQFTDLLWLFDCANYPPDSNYLFLGDFIDRGRNSLEVAALFMAYKVKYPNRFFFLRGNHESNAVNENYSFRVECLTRFPESSGTDMWNKFGDFFNWLPVAAVIGRKIFCVHGGLSPQLKTLEAIKKIERPIETPTKGLLCDLVWADPENTASGWKFNEARAISYRFGTDIMKVFLDRNKLNLIVRAHELMKKGYEIMSNMLITVFSAPNYTGIFGNNGAVLIVDEDMECTILTMNYKLKKEKKITECEQKSNVFRH